MPNSAPHPASAQRPQFSLRTMLSCMAVVAVSLASVTQLGDYSIGILPACVSLLVVLIGGGSWRDGLLLTLYVYGVALAGVIVLLTMTVLAVAIGVAIG